MSEMPPGPPLSPFRQLLRLVNEPYAFYQDAYRAHGPLTTVHVFGQEPWVLVGDPEVVRAIFHSSADELHGDSDGVKYLVGPNTVLFLDGEAHRRERRALTPPFKHERMAGYAERMLASIDDAIDALGAGDEVVALELMQQVTLRVIVECIFGVSDARRRDRLSRLLAHHLRTMQTGAMAGMGMALGGDRIRSLLRAGVRAYRTPFRDDDPPPSRNPIRRFFETKSEIDDLLRTELGKARRGEREGLDDVLGMLAVAHYDDGVEMSEESRMDELFALLVGGHETTAITMAWTLYYLARDPAILARVREELAGIFGDGPVDASGIERARYLHAVIDETLRIRPVAAAIPRKLTSDVVFGGYRLRAGTRTFPSPAILHFREDLWPEPETFRPERFLEARPSPFRFLPFGGGSRACLGRPFATIEMRLVLASLLLRLDFRLAPRAAPEPALLGILTGPSDGVPLLIERIRPRAAKKRVADDGRDAGAHDASA